MAASARGPSEETRGKRVRERWLQRAVIMHEQNRRLGC
jgi:hypothetical protein